MTCIALVLILLSLCGCARESLKAPDSDPAPEQSAPEEIVTPEKPDSSGDILPPEKPSSQDEIAVPEEPSDSNETATPEEPSDPMDEIYPIETPEDAAKILEQAYEQMIPQLTFAFTEQELSLQERSIFLQNASNQVIAQRQELKYAYQLECEDSADGTVCKILYMPYKLGYPDGIPEDAAEVYALSDLIRIANQNLGQDEISIAIRNPDLLVDDMQRALQLAGYGYIIYQLSSDATSLRAYPSDFKTLEQCTEAIADLKDLAHTIAGEIFTDDMDDTAKLRAIYGCITSNTTYDNRYYQAPETLPYESRTAYGPLKYGTAICGGFSWAFNMLCEEAGIPCWNVTGTGTGDTHMWNCALIDGAYRYFDTTWDAGASDAQQWRYFARTEDEITQDHQWGIGQEELMHALTEA